MNNVDVLETSVVNYIFATIIEILSKGKGQVNGGNKLLLLIEDFSQPLGPKKICQNLSA